mgnify:CR=1 FL=1
MHLQDPDGGGTRLLSPVVHQFPAGPSSSANSAEDLHSAHESHEELDDEAHHGAGAKLGCVTRFQLFVERWENPLVAFFTLLGLSLGVVLTFTLPAKDLLEIKPPPCIPGDETIAVSDNCNYNTTLATDYCEYSFALDGSHSNTLNNGVFGSECSTLSVWRANESQTTFETVDGCCVPVFKSTDAVFWSAKFNFSFFGFCKQLGKDLEPAQTAFAQLPSELAGLFIYSNFRIGEFVPPSASSTADPAQLNKSLGAWNVDACHFGPRGTTLGFVCDNGQAESSLSRVLRIRAGDATDWPQVHSSEQDNTYVSIGSTCSYGSTEDLFRNRQPTVYIRRAVSVTYSSEGCDGACVNSFPQGEDLIDRYARNALLPAAIAALFVISTPFVAECGRRKHRKMEKKKKAAAKQGGAPLRSFGAAPLLGSPTGGMLGDSEQDLHLRTNDGDSGGNYMAHV